MLAILSPAKMLNMEPVKRKVASTAPRLVGSHGDAIAGALGAMTKTQLKAVLGVSDALATINHQRYRDWVTASDGGEAAGKPCTFAYTGMAFKAFGAPSLSDDELEYAQRHVRVIDAVYGVLRPCDRIQAYRLEMQSKLAPPGGAAKDLYEYWSDAIREVLLDDFRELGSEAGGAGGSDAPRVLVNLASAEYSKAVRFVDGDSVTVVDVAFKGVPVKKGRGLMARWIAQRQPATIEELKEFAVDGISFDERASKEHHLVFVAGKAGGAGKPTATKRRQGNAAPRGKRAKR